MTTRTKDKEGHAAVLAIVASKRLSGPNLGTAELVEKIGVRDARSQPFQYTGVVTDNGRCVAVCPEPRSLAHLKASRTLRPNPLPR